MRWSNVWLWRVGLLGLVWFVMTQEGHAWERPPVKIKTHIEFHVEYRIGPDIRRPTAPWYAYFPVDPRVVPSQQLTPYPPWPVPFPPLAVPKQAMTRTPNADVRPDARVSQLWDNQRPYGTTFQPVGYFSTQAPTYWYHNP